MEQNENSLTPESATDEPDSSANLPAGLLDFDPVSTRYRIDGITPEKQREYVEALADTGLARVAAARIGVSEQAICRLRRRADARSFNLACEGARRIGARRLHSIAWERAIEGTLRGHYYHGERVSEERVYDNRLLIHLLGQTQHLVDDDRDEVRAIAENWEPYVEAIGKGLPAPDLPPPYDPWAGLDKALDEDEDEDEEEDEEDYSDLAGFIDIWEKEEGNGDWVTLYPPPAGFDGEEWGEVGTDDYSRTLTARELTVMHAVDAAVLAEEIAVLKARRDRVFGYDGGSRDDEVSSPGDAETYEPNETSDPRPEEPAAGSDQGPPPPIAERAAEEDKAP